MRSAAASAAATCSGCHVPPPTSATPSSPWRAARRGPALRSALPATHTGQRGRCVHAMVVRRPPAAATGSPVRAVSRSGSSASSRSARARVVGQRLVERRVLAVAVVAQAQPEDRASAGQPVQRRRVLGDDLPAPARQRRHERPEPHALRRGRDRGERDPRVGERLAGVVEQVVPDEDAVPARRLGVRRERGDRGRVGELLGQRDREAPAQRRHRRTVAGAVARGFSG